MAIFIGPTGVPDPYLHVTISTSEYVPLSSTQVSRMEGIGSAGEAKEIPTAFSLSANYPNPFNPSTTIRFGLPKASHVTLAVYNTLGQEVAVLVDGEQREGFHEAKFDASALSSGIYYYRLRAADFVETKRMLVLR
jgi:hypothetical protein